MQTVTLSNNNSGGSYWLSESQIDALLADGWRIDPNHDPEWLDNGRAGAYFQLDVPVSDEDAAATIAMIEFQRVTGEDPNAIGCTCCGPPFSFDTWKDRFEDPEVQEHTITVTVQTTKGLLDTIAQIHELLAKSDLSVEDVIGEAV